MTPTARLFLALWPTDAARAAVLDHALLWNWPATARLTHPERIHLTLHFLGSVSVDRLDELKSGLAVDFEPFDVVLDAPELWRGGLGVLCASEVPPRLRSLHERLAARLRELGLPVEARPLRVHATLAREAWRAMPPRSAQAVQWPAQDGYALVRSLPGGQGYEVVRRFG